jgi:hypothetical protein
VSIPAAISGDVDLHHNVDLDFTSASCAVLASCVHDRRQDDGERL